MILFYLLAALWADVQGAPVHACIEDHKAGSSVFIDRTPRKDDLSLSLYVTTRDGRLTGFDVSRQAVLPDGCDGEHILVHPGAVEP